MEKTRVGFALCGSFCTLASVISQIKKFVGMGFDVLPIMSEITYNTDSRFGSAKSFIDKIEEITGKKIINSVKQAEVIGPKKLLDILVIAPCTGNTAAKIALGVSDTSVTMACKSHLRNQRPVLISLASNDALGNGAKNIAHLLNMKNVYLVPFEQDDCINKPNSLISNVELIYESAIEAMGGRQIQPVLYK